MLLELASEFIPRYTCIMFKNNPNFDLKILSEKV